MIELLGSCVLVLGTLVLFFYLRQNTQRYEVGEEQLDKQWCVIQDLSPFGIRIDSRHWTRAGAERRALAFRRHDVRAMRTEEARALDREVVELAAHTYGFSAEDVLDG